MEIEAHSAWREAVDAEPLTWAEANMCPYEHACEHTYEHVGEDVGEHEQLEADPERKRQRS